MPSTSGRAVLNRRRLAMRCVRTVWPVETVALSQNIPPGGTWSFCVGHEEAGCPGHHGTTILLVIEEILLGKMSQSSSRYLNFASPLHLTPVDISNTQAAPRGDSGRWQHALKINPTLVIFSVRFEVRHCFFLVDILGHCGRVKTAGPPDSRFTPFPCATMHVVPPHVGRLLRTMEFEMILATALR